MSYQEGKSTCEAILGRKLTPDEELRFRKMLDTLHIESGSLTSAVGFFYTLFSETNKLPEKTREAISKAVECSVSVMEQSNEKINELSEKAQKTLQADAASLHSAAEKMEKRSLRLSFIQLGVAAFCMLFCALFCYLFYGLGKDAAPALSPEAQTFFQSKNGQEVFEWYKLGRLDDVIGFMNSPSGSIVDGALLEPDRAIELQEILTCEKTGWTKEKKGSAMVCTPSGSFTLPLP